MEDGSLIQEVGNGGQVYIVQKDVQFFRDVFPNFFNSVLVVGGHLIFRYTENSCLILWLIFGLSTLSGLFGPPDNQNISKKNQREWENDYRFLLPLYCYTFLETISWLYCLILMSDSVGNDYEWKKTRP